MATLENLEGKVHKTDEKLSARWTLPSDLFPDTDFPSLEIEIYDFEFSHYNSFLDSVNSPGDLLRGLEELSPFANDALAIAEKLGEDDFRKFKTALALERSTATDRIDQRSEIPQKWLPIVLPVRFIQAQLLAEEYEVCLGAALVRLMRIEAGSSGGV